MPNQDKKLLRHKFNLVKNDIFRCLSQTISQMFLIRHLPLILTASGEFYLKLYSVIPKSK